ncbi:putative ribonuclease H-like domain-containing protein [Tanacetum coccineum]
MDDIGIFGNAYDDEDVEKEVNMNNGSSSYAVPDTPFIKFHRDHPEDQTLVDLPRDKWVIGTKWVFRNKKDERGIVVKNKARLVAQGYTQKERINYDEVFAPIARIEAIRLFLAYASFMGFIVYQIHVNSAFLYGTTEEEVHVCQPPSFEDPYFPDKVYKVEKAHHRLHQASKACHDKYMVDILKKFDYSSVKTTSTLMEPNKPLIKDEEAKNVDVYMYRSMIRSLMYLTASRPDIIFAVYETVYKEWGGRMERVATTALEQDNDLVDEKKVIVNETSIRSDLRLDDTEGTTCLPNEAIFKELARMGAKTTAWNEFSSTMASAIICLANNQKFNFPKYIFQSMLKNLDDGIKFLMYPSVPIPINDPLPSGEDIIQLNELMVLCTKLQKQVLHLKEAMTSQEKEIVGLKKRVKTLEMKRKSRFTKLKRLKKIGAATRVKSSEEKDSLGHQEDASKLRRIIDNIDQDVEIMLVDETQWRMNDQEMFGVNDLDGDEVVVDESSGEKVEHGEKLTTVDIEDSVVASTILVTKEELTLAQTLVEIKAKVTGATTVTAAAITRPNVKDDGDDVTTEATPLSTKILIIDYKIYKEEQKSSFQIMRADGNSQTLHNPVSSNE